MPDNEKLIEEVKELEEKNLPLTKHEASMMVGYLALVSAVMGSRRFRHLTILEPDIALVAALINALDPRADMIVSLSEKVAKLAGAPSLQEVKNG